jgi:hypothetical protein
VSLMRDAAARQWQALVIALFAIAIVTSCRFLAIGEPHVGIEAQHRAIESRLEATPGNHLILVPSQFGHCVYNGADIDAQRVVWARQLGGASDEALLRYYRSRHVWIMAGDDSHLAVTPFTGE